MTKPSVSQPAAQTPPPIKQDISSRDTTQSKLASEKSNAPVAHHTSRGTYVVSSTPTTSSGSSASRGLSVTAFAFFTLLLSSLPLSSASDGNQSTELTSETKTDIFIVGAGVFCATLLLFALTFYCACKGGQAIGRRDALLELGSAPSEDPLRTTTPTNTESERRPLIQASNEHKKTFTSSIKEQVLAFCGKYSGRSHF